MYRATSENSELLSDLSVHSITSSGITDTDKVGFLNQLMNFENYILPQGFWLVEFC
jgi:hypothetical protein